MSERQRPYPPAGHSGTYQLRCPTCGRFFAREETQFAPFCSERCKMIDLGNWFDGTFRIPGDPADVSTEPTEDDPDTT